MAEILSRSAVARILGIGRSRVSRMESGGQLTKAQQYSTQDPTQDITGWPASYIQYVANQRKGVLTSPSLLGHPTSGAPAARIVNAFINDPDRYSKAVHLQIFTTLEGKVAVFTGGLDHTPDQPWSGLAPLISGTRPIQYLDEEFTQWVMKIADDYLDGDPFSCHWLTTSVWDHEERFTELVVHLNPDKPMTGKYKPSHLIATFGPISGEAVAAKLGRKVPLLPFPMRDQLTFDQWQQAGAVDDVQVLRDLDCSEQRASAAVILSHLEVEDAELRDVLAHALAAQVNWERSNQPASTRLMHYLAGAQHLGAGAHFVVTPVAPDLTGRYRKFFPENIPTATVQELREAGAWAQKLDHHRFGTYGDAPDRRISLAIGYALAAINRALEELTEYGERIETVHFHTIRACKERKLPPGYQRSLRPANKIYTPAYRELERADEYALDGMSLHLVDPFGTPIVRHVRRGSEWEAEEFDIRYHLAVPMLNAGDRAPSDFTFETIRVNPDAQAEPIWLKIGEQWMPAPFAIEDPMKFTHGYGGTGPSNLLRAMAAFVEWAFRKKLSSDGLMFLRRIIMNDTAQGAVLEISRRQLDQDSFFEPIDQVPSPMRGEAATADEN